MSAYFLNDQLTQQNYYLIVIYQLLVNLEVRLLAETKRKKARLLANQRNARVNVT